MLIFDIWIDFVNLRSEKYAENSRIPTVVCTHIKHCFFFPELCICCYVHISIIYLHVLTI